MNNNDGKHAVIAATVSPQPPLIEVSVKERKRRILHTVLLIFRSEWKTFIMISFLLLLAMFSVTVIYLLLMFFLFLFKVYGNVRNFQNQLLWSSNSIIGIFSSAILQFSSTSSIITATRLLEEQENNNDDYYVSNRCNDDYYVTNRCNDDYSMSSDMWIKVGVELFISFVFFMLLISLVWSIFKGALLRSAAVTYVGYKPSVLDCLRVGCEKCWSMYGYTIFIGFVNFAIFLPLIVGLPGMLIALADGVEVLSIVVLFPLAAICVASVMNGGGPSIIVEGKSAMEAIKRSWHLSTACFGTIIATYCCFIILELSVSMLLASIALYDNSFLRVLFTILKCLFFLVMTSLGSIMVVVLYMTARSQLEGCTQEMLIEELKLAMVTPLVEMSDQTTNTTTVLENNETKNDSTVVMGQIV